MRDITGFALLLVFTILIIWVLVAFVLPFLATYLLGIMAFLVIASRLVRKGRLHPAHLDSLLKPGVGRAVLLTALLAPLVHGLLFALLSPASEWWWLVALLNGVPALAWTTHLLLAHRRQLVRYYAEGHAIEDAIERAVARDAALEVRVAALESLAALHQPPEPWELAAGVEDRALLDPRPAIADTIASIAEIRAQYAAPISQLREALAAVQAGEGVLEDRVRAAMATIAGLEMEWERQMSGSEAILLSHMWGTPAGWED